MEIKKPIKRNAAIVEFSKDHHFALLLVWKIREGLRRSIEPERITRYILNFFDTDLNYHFKDEEEFLFNKIPATHELRIRAETEHKEIREMINELRNDPADRNLIGNFADTLEKHIRFEERELFNYLQQNIPADILAELVTSVQPRPHESDKPWDDVFWKEKTPKI